MYFFLLLRADFDNIPQDYNSAGYQYSMEDPHLEYLYIDVYDDLHTGQWVARTDLLGTHSNIVCVWST